jgi:hypothetical protein
MESTETKDVIARFQVLTAVSMKMTVFWDVIVWWKFADVSEVLIGSSPTGSRI